jgi:hypothetical protein
MISPVVRELKRVSPHAMRLVVPIAPTTSAVAVWVQAPAHDLPASGTSVPATACDARAVVTAASE